MNGVAPQPVMLGYSQWCGPTASGAGKPVMRIYS